MLFLGGFCEVNADFGENNEGKWKFGDFACFLGVSGDFP
jgi:hypothetical protein